MLKYTNLSILAFVLLFNAQVAGAGGAQYAVVPDMPTPPPPPEKPSSPKCEILDIMHC